MFLDDDFVGVAAIDGTAPGDELELALGVDDRVVAERELVRRHADKRRLGSTRRTDEVWSITVTNHRSRPIDLVVRDRVPQSRHAEVKVVDVKLRPEPAEHDDLGRFECAGRRWPRRRLRRRGRLRRRAPQGRPAGGLALGRRSAARRADDGGAGAGHHPDPPPRPPESSPSSIVAQASSVARRRS